MVVAAAMLRGRLLEGAWCRDAAVASSVGVDRAHVEDWCAKAGVAWGYGARGRPLGGRRVGVQAIGDG